MSKRKLYPILLVLALCLAPAAVGDDGGPAGWIQGVWESVLEAVGFGDAASPDLSGPDFARSAEPDKLDGDPSDPAQNDGESDPIEDPEMAPHPSPNG